MIDYILKQIFLSTIFAALTWLGFYLRLTAQQREVQIFGLVIASVMIGILSVQAASRFFDN